MSVIIVEAFPFLKNRWEEVKDFFIEKTVGPKTVLLREGDMSENIYFIKKGLLRLWNNSDGNDISLQFFFQGQLVSSFESFYANEPSMFTLESIEESELLVLSKENFEILIKKYPNMEHYITEIISRRFMEYIKYFLSRIKEKPEARYKKLIEFQPEVAERVPDYHVASYLGITPVSLSRIKKRIK